MKPWIAAHPALAFVGLTLGCSWTAWSPLFVLAGRGGLLHDAPPAAFAVAAAGALGPSLVGLALTAWLDGRAGLAALGARLRDAAAGRWWWALLLIPAATAVTPLMQALAGTPVDLTAIVQRVGPAIGLGLAAGLMEEFGWRGFLLPRLLSRYRLPTAALLVGLVWGALWHGYADYFGVPGDGWTFVALIVLLGPGLLTAWALVLAIVYAHTRGSLLVAVLMHASISSSAFVVGAVEPAPAARLGWTAFSVAVAWTAAAALWFATRRCPPAAGARAGGQRRSARMGATDSSPKHTA